MHIYLISNSVLHNNIQIEPFARIANINFLVDDHNHDLVKLHIVGKNNIKCNCLLERDTILKIIVKFV